jgi:hypothetical protein
MTYLSSTCGLSSPVQKFQCLVSRKVKSPSSSWVAFLLEAFEITDIWNDDKSKPNLVYRECHRKLNQFYSKSLQDSVSKEESSILIDMSRLEDRADKLADSKWHSDREVALRVLTAVVHQVLPWTYVVPETEHRLLDHHVDKKIMMQMVRIVAK